MSDEAAIAAVKEALLVQRQFEIVEKGVKDRGPADPKWERYEFARGWQSAVEKIRQRIDEFRDK